MTILKRQFLFGLLLWGVFATQAFALTQIESFKTPKGIHVWLVPDKTVQAITIAFSVPGGAIMTADKAGVSGLTERMLSKGSGPYTNHQFQELLEGLGIEMGAGFSADFFSGSLRTTYDNRVEAFRLFKEYINHPRFESSEFELVRQEYLTYVQNAQKSPAYVLERMIAEKFFAKHPYGIPMDGTNTCGTF
jgi:zinc protease